MTDSFVASLVLADEPRLPLPVVARSSELRRGSDVAPPPEVPDNLRAAVNAGAILSFVAGLDAGEASDVIYSTQCAHRAADHRHDRFADTEAWYNMYFQVLRQLGWASEAFAFHEATSAAGTLRMDRAALDVIQAIATGGQLAILVKTMDAMKALAENDRPLKIFDLMARRDLSGNFQIGAAQRADNGAISLALGGFRFTATDHRGAFLFWNWGAREVKFWTAASKLTLNREAYAIHRAAVRAKLDAEAARYIAALDIA